MKKLLTGLALSVAMTAPVFASDVIKQCKAFEELASSIMSARQNNVSITKSLEIVGDNESMKSIVMDAYSQPAMRTPENALRQRAEFANKWAMLCIKANSR